MSSRDQDAVCAFVRQIIAARSGEATEVTDRPELAHRNSPAVEELWESRSRRYAVEHTRLESYDGQLSNEAQLGRLIMPVREMLAGRLPGTYVLTVCAEETKQARVPYARVHEELIRLTLETAPVMRDGQTTILSSNRMPFRVQLHRRHGMGSQVLVRCAIEEDGELLRLQRVRRAFEDKCPKLAAWSQGGRVSVLVLEANELQLSNFSLVWEAVKKVMGERADIPDMIVFVETDLSPMNGWVFKEGGKAGGEAPTLNGGWCYTEGKVLTRHRSQIAIEEPARLDA